MSGGRLSVFKNISAKQAEKQNKTSRKSLKDKALKIILERKLGIAEYLDVTLNLNDGKYHSFHKPNDEIT